MLLSDCIFNIVLLLQITKKWELALQKEIPQDLHEVSCVGFCVQHTVQHIHLSKNDLYCVKQDVFLT